MPSLQKHFDTRSVSLRTFVIEVNMRCWSRCALFLVALSSSAWSQTLQYQGPPLHRVVHRNTFALRYNPLGLLYEGRFMYRLRLYESDSIALRDNFVGIGLTPIASPAFVRAGPYVEIQPMTVLGFWASYTFVQYFGTFNLFQSFPSARSNFSDAEITRLGELAKGPTGGGEYLTNGTELTLGLDFQVKVLDFILRSRARLIRADMRLRDGDTVFYDQFYDVMVPNRGWYFVNDADLLYQTPNKRFVGGLRYTASLMFYNQTHFQNGEVQENLNNMHRVGPFLGYTFKIDDGASFNNPTVFVLIQWWLQNRNRTGTAQNPDGISQALPLLGVGFQMTGDFLPVPKPAPRTEREWPADESVAAASTVDVLPERLGLVMPHK